MISMLGSVLSGFAMSLLVLDYTKSTFLFALYNVFYMLPNIVIPVLSGPVLDRFSRRKTIYTLDFLTSGIFVILAVILGSGYFSFAVLAVACLIIGTIESMYAVAYESFYPLLISEGNYSKAYSIASTLETLTMVAVPISALLYNKIGIVPLFLIDAASYFIAAVMETQITAKEEYIEKQEETRDKELGVVRQFVFDFKQGLSYLISEKGLLAVCIYFLFSNLEGSAANSVTLPYFKSTFENGEYIYMLVWGMCSVGRAVGGGIHYKFKLPPGRKFLIALVVYISISVFEGTYLFTPVPVMMILCFLTGIFGVTSYNIRISATQKYVPDEKKGRFNGTFNTIITVGNLVGHLIAGALAEFMPIRLVIIIFTSLNVVAALVFIYGNKAHVKKLYNVSD